VAAESPEENKVLNLILTQLGSLPFTFQSIGDVSEALLSVQELLINELAPKANVLEVQEILNYDTEDFAIRFHEGIK
jgi:hypothetical protein